MSAFAVDKDKDNKDELITDINDSTSIAIDDEWMISDAISDAVSSNTNVRFDKSNEFKRDKSDDNSLIDCSVYNVENTILRGNSMSPSPDTGGVYDDEVGDELINCDDDVFKDSKNIESENMIQLVSNSNGLTTSSESYSDNNTKKDKYYSIFIKDLYFVTKDGLLDGVNSKSMNWVINKIAVELEFDVDLTDTMAVENLRLRVEEKYPHKISTLEVIEMYLKYNYCNQLFVVSDSLKSDKSNTLI